MPKSIAVDPRFPMNYWLVPEKAIPVETPGMARPQLYHPTFSMFWNGPGDTDYHGLDGEKEYRRIALDHRYHVIYGNHDSNGTDTSAATTVVPLYDRVTNTVIQKEVFVKYSPLLDPFKYMVGKYVFDDPKLRILPSPPSIAPGGGNCCAIANGEPSTTSTPHPKIAHPMNSSYVDAFFYYLTSMLLQHHGFVHGIDFYGSHLGVQDRFRINIEEDLEYLADSPFFLANIGKIMALEHCDQDDLASLTHLEKYGNGEGEDVDGNVAPPNHGSRYGKRILTIHKDDHDRNNHINSHELKFDIVDELNAESTMMYDVPKPDPADNAALDALDLDHIDALEQHLGIVTHDNDDDNDSLENNSEDDDNPHLDALAAGAHETTSTCEDDSDDDDYVDDDDDDDEGESDNDDYETVSDDENQDHPAPPPPTAVIYQFPVQAIYLERCTGTFDELLERDLLRPEEIQSALFQIVMILLVYQRAFKFTHNDLHTNNIMYVTTDIEYLWYHYEDYTYRVPTYGRIYKIIDYGRSIYEFRGRRFCSDSFAPGGDGATQYNCEPFLNPHKPRLEPNPSFDLCRLGCSIYDFITESREDVDADQPSQNTEFDATIRRWCSNDQGRNMLYKSNGQERYPGFHLYKMIARTVHAHTPAAQLEHPWFQAFRLPKNTSQLPATNEPYMDLRRIPTYHL